MGRAHAGDDDLPAALAEADRLRLQVSTLLVTQRQLSTLLVAADTRTGALLKLLVAVRALIESRNAPAAMESLQDILVTVLGAEKFTIYAIDPRQQLLVAIAGTSTPTDASDRVPLHDSWLGGVVRSAAVHVPRDTDRPARRGDTDVVAVVPLRVLDRVVGAIVITRLVPHREALDSCDREVLGLLGVYAATAIIAADRRGRWRELPDMLR
jgi:GAF domain-containing protein